MGRPVTLTPEKKAALLDLVRAGRSLQDAARALGSCERTVWRERRRDPEWLAKLSTAVAEGSVVRRRLALVSASTPEAAERRQRRRERSQTAREMARERRHQEIERRLAELRGLAEQIGGRP